MPKVRLSYSEYWDKVYACWLGKNCGGTLGGPLERAWGEPEPFNIWWYPEIREGGIPNDDLEIQLIWLKALEEIGFGLTARNLAQYWLDHIGYNPDEYGLSKTNLRLGLLPPISGAYNNWFRDCMGAPIRTEIWACIAPGVPALAVAYAYQDAICDHAGGEGVFGAIFNAAVEAAAFVINDRDILIEIGLSYIPPDSQVAKAVRVAREAHMAGLTWQEARQKVLEAVPHYNAQYAPINLGFQVIGWLYGDDFGDSLCKAVNCGYDTDCTGATLGSILGILLGRNGIPARWIEPLGDAISTSEQRGGIKHASAGHNPIPRTLGELTDRICRLGRQLLTVKDTYLQIDDVTDLSGLRIDDLLPPDWVKDLWTANPWEVTFDLDSLSVTLDYMGPPVINYRQKKPICIRMRNPHPEPVRCQIEFLLPQRWTITPKTPWPQQLAPGEEKVLQCYLGTEDPITVRNTNLVLVNLLVEQRPAEMAVPLVLVGGRRWLVCGPFLQEGVSDLLDFPFTPEDEVRIAPNWTKFSEKIEKLGWIEVIASGNALGDAFDFNKPGVWYARAFLKSSADKTIHIGIPANCPLKLWINGDFVGESRRLAPIRPSYQ